MKNGACLRYKGQPQLFCDYNALPSESVAFSSKIREIHAKDAGINTIGFEHLKDTAIERVYLENCGYVDDSAIGRLAHIKDTLTELEIVGCKNITDEGLKQAKNLVNLKLLKSSQLLYVKNAADVKAEVQKALPNCKIEFN